MNSHLLRVGLALRIAVSTFVTPLDLHTRESPVRLLTEPGRLCTKKRVKEARMSTRKTCTCQQLLEFRFKRLDWSWSLPAEEGPGCQRVSLRNTQQDF